MQKRDGENLKKLAAKEGWGATSAAKLFAAIDGMRQYDEARLKKKLSKTHIRGVYCRFRTNDLQKLGETHRSDFKFIAVALKLYRILPPLLGDVPWDAVAAMLSGPINPTTDKPYRGINVLLLMCNQHAFETGDPRFCSFKQAKDKDWSVRKGEKSEI